VSSVSTPDPKLKLPQSPRLRVFRVIDRHLRADQTLRRVVRPGSFKSWTGEPGDRNIFALEQFPAIRLTPSSGPDQFWATSGMLGNLTIDVEMCVRGTCWEDIDSLWMAVQRALYPIDTAARNAFLSALQTAGAHTGEAKFSAIVADVDPGEADAFIGRALIVMEYRLNLRPDQVSHT
jgi:hypothetical protein